MADKVSAGQPIPRSASLWNNIIGSANAFAAQQLGQPGGRNTQPIPTDVVKIKNSSGSHIRLGEVLEISGFLLTNVLRDSLWFDGDEPDGTRPFAIALQDIPDGSIDRAQVSGVTVALVNVTDADHGYATTEDGEIVLQSADIGPIRILYKPTGTGEKTCAVLFDHFPPGRLWRVTLNEAFGATTAHIAAADLLTIDGTDTGRDVSLYDPLDVFAILQGTEGLYCFEQIDVDGTRYFVPLQSPCPGS